jgi:hypothetical protein
VVCEVCKRKLFARLRRGEAYVCEDLKAPPCPGCGIPLPPGESWRRVEAKWEEVKCPQ